MLALNSDFISKDNSFIYVVVRYGAIQTTQTMHDLDNSRYHCSLTTKCVTTYVQ